MRTTLWPLHAAILASLAMAAAPAFAQQDGSSGFGGSASHQPPLPTHLPKSKPKPKTSQKTTSPPAEAQPAQAAQPAPPAAAVIVIDSASTYEDALKCYQFHGVAMQIATAMKGRANLAENQKAQYESVAKMSGYLQQKWFQRIGEIKTVKKTAAEMNADLQTVAGSIVTDANAGLGGDKDAQARNDAVKTACKGFEKIETQAASPATPG